MIAALIATYALWLLLVLLFIRMVMEYVMMFSRTYRPTGVVAATMEIVYTVTDPPLKALRRVIPPLRLGTVLLDVAFIVLATGALILIRVLEPYR